METSPQPEPTTVRFSIGLKIFSIAVGLMVLMAAVALYSFIKIGQVNREVEEITQFQMPLKDHLVSVNLHAMQQEIHLATLVRYYLSDPTETDAIAQEMTQFQNLSQQIDKEIETATALAQEAMQSDEAAEHLQTFAEVVPVLQAVEASHQVFYDHALKIISALQKNDKDHAKTMLTTLTTERSKLNLQMERALSTLTAFTEASIQEAAQHEKRAVQVNSILTLIAIALGLLTALKVTIGLVRPVRQLAHTTQEIERGNLDVSLQVDSRDEVGILTQSFNHMTSELRLKERIKETFGKYIDPRIVEDLIQHPDTMVTQGEQRVMTVLFSDIEGFTPISEKLQPESLVLLLNHYLTMATQSIKASNGVIDKYIGDAVMAFWGPPFTKNEAHAQAACETALETFSDLENFRTQLPNLMKIDGGVPNINIRIGIATGELVVGNIGSDVSKSYTAIGDTVNLASRLEGANKQYGTRILISEGTKNMVGDAVETREIDQLQVVGKSEPVRVFEVMAQAEALDEERTKVRDLFEEGLAAYRAQNWDAAATQFESCLSINANDGPAKVFLERVAHLRQTPPEKNWDGVWRLDHK